MNIHALHRTQVLVIITLQYKSCKTLINQKLSDLLERRVSRKKFLGGNICALLPMLFCKSDFSGGIDSTSPHKVLVHTYTKKYTNKVTYCSYK